MISKIPSEIIPITIPKKDEKIVPSIPNINPPKLHLTHSAKSLLAAEPTIIVKRKTRPKINVVNATNCNNVIAERITVNVTPIEKIIPPIIPTSTIIPAEHLSQGFCLFIAEPQLS